MGNVKGGSSESEALVAPISSKCGHFYTISGECRADGSSCWPF